MPVKFASEGEPLPRFVYSPYGERPGATIVVAMTNELERWITCKVERVDKRDLHVVPCHP
jgi:hypothetical protein